MLRMSESDKDKAWAEKLEDASNQSRTMVMRIRGKRVAVRVMTRPFNDALLDEACAALGRGK